MSAVTRTLAEDRAAVAEIPWDHDGICPLRYGGYVKVKMLEARRAGKAIVATDVDCQGLTLGPTAVRCATTAAGFGRGIAELLTIPSGERVPSALRAASSCPPGTTRPLRLPSAGSW